VVLDPFLGTGTTAIAAKQLQRHYIGIELDPMYQEIAQEKLANIEAPTLYRGYAVSMFLNKIQSIRDCDAAALFPPQLTSQEKKKLRTNGHQRNGKSKNGVLPQPVELELPF
jgi:tRNA G10  N-methylase Trm11